MFPGTVRCFLGANAQLFESLFQISQHLQVFYVLHLLLLYILWSMGQRCKLYNQIQAILIIKLIFCCLSGKRELTQHCEAEPKAVLEQWFLWPNCAGGGRQQCAFLLCEARQMGACQKRTSRGLGHKEDESVMVSSWLMGKGGQPHSQGPHTLHDNTRCHQPQPCATASHPQPLRLCPAMRGHVSAFSVLS